MRPTPALLLAAAALLLSAQVPRAAAGPEGNTIPKSASAPGVTSLLIDSEPGEYVGGGEFNFYTPDEGLLETPPYPPSPPGDIYLVFNGPRVPSWTLWFSPPEGESLAVGAYEDAVKPYMREMPGQPGLEVTGVGDCFGTLGRFEVKQVVSDAGGKLTAFWASFEQTCGRQVLRGEVRLNADVPVVLTAPSRRTVAEGHELSFAVGGHNLGGSPTALAAAGMPAGAVLSDAGDGTGRFAWTPGPGQAGRYWMALHGTSTGGDSDVVYTRINVVPDLDDFDKPITITSLPFWLRIEDPQMSVAPDDPPGCGPQAGGTIWYTFTPTVDARIQALSYSLRNGLPATVSIVSGERGALESLACGWYFARADVLAGRTYHIELAYWASTPEQALGVDFLPLPPANDDFEHATIVPALPFTEMIEAGGARSEEADPGFCGSVYHNLSPNIWYSYTPESDMRVTIDTSGGPFGTQYAFISVLTGSYGALAPVACDQVRVSFNARAGQTYYAMLSGPIIPLQVEYQVSITGVPILGVEVTVSREGSVNPRSGRAVVRGTATCSRPAQITLSGLLIQFPGPAKGSFASTIDCAGATSWSAEVTPDLRGARPRRFSRGSAGVIHSAVAVSTDDPDDTVNLAVRQTPILLKMGRPR